MKSTHRLLTTAAAVIAFAFAFSASAVPIYTIQTSPDNTGTANVISSPTCLQHIDVGNPVEGCLNTDHNQLVQMSTTGATETVPNSGLHYAPGGQANVDGGNGTTNGTNQDPVFFQDLTITAVNFSFNKIVLNIDLAPNTSGVVQFFDGGSAIDGSFALTSTGNNFFTITKTDGTFNPFSLAVFTNATLTTWAPIIDDVQQIRIGGGAAVVPEPNTLALLGLALAGLGLTCHRKA